MENQLSKCFCAGCGAFKAIVGLCEVCNAPFCSESCNQQSAGHKLICDQTFTKRVSKLLSLVKRPGMLVTRYDQNMYRFEEVNCVSEGGFCFIGKSLNTCCSVCESSYMNYARYSNITPYLSIAKCYRCHKNSRGYCKTSCELSTECEKKHKQSQIFLLWATKEIIVNNCLISDILQIIQRFLIRDQHICNIH